MALRVYILGDAVTYQNYALAVERAGGIPCFGSRPADCDCLLLPGGGDMESWRYGQKNTACRDLEPERDALELDLLADFTALGKPVLGICRGMQTINVFFGGDLVQDWPGHSAIEGVDWLHSVQNAPSFLRELYGERCMVNSCHHQIIGRLGTGLEVLQRAEDGVVDPMAPGTADSGLPNGHGGRTGGIPGVSISDSLVRALPVNRRPYPDRTGTVHHDPPIRGKSGRKDFL